MGDEGAPRDFSNVCILAPTLDVFGYRECQVFDPHPIIRDRYGKSYSRPLRVVSSGAFAHILWHRVADPLPFMLQHRGRTVAIVADPRARSLSDFRFEADDLLVVGSESDGLPASILGSATAAGTVPAYGRTQSLNLAVAARERRRLRPTKSVWRTRDPALVAVCLTLYSVRQIP